MTKPFLASFLLTALALQTLGCGSSMSNSNRVLQSITVSPASADAQNFPNGQVQFTAMGTFSKPPSPAQLTFQPPYSGGWSMMGTGLPPIATISQTGLAQCLPGTTGTATVQALASVNSAQGPAMSIAVTGTAQLTCP